MVLDAPQRGREGKERGWNAESFRVRNPFYTDIPVSLSPATELGWVTSTLCSSVYTLYTSNTAINSSLTSRFLDILGLVGGAGLLLLLLVLRRIGCGCALQHNSIHESGNECATKGTGLDDHLLALSRSTTRVPSRPSANSSGRSTQRDPGSGRGLESINTLNSADRQTGLRTSESHQ